MNTTLTKTPEPDIATVKEKILLEKQLPFDPKNKKGPTTELFFHELPSGQTVPQRLFQLVVGLLWGICFLITMPVVALYIKIVSSGPVFCKERYTGQRGHVFELLTYRMIDRRSSNPYTGATFLKKSGIYKLPAILNMLKGKLNLVGPHPYPERWCNKWNKELSDFYKRFALKPGLLSITPELKNPDDIEKVAETLERELSYILNPTLAKDIKRFLGQYQ